MLKPKVFAEDGVDDLRAADEEEPALVADARALAARADRVVRVHIDIKDQLFLLGLELGNALVERRVCVENRSHVDLFGRQLHELLLQFFLGLKAAVAGVNVVGREGKLAQLCIVRVGFAVAEPVEKGGHREQTRIVHLERLLRDNVHRVHSKARHGSR